jgi:formylglycine-generating enzyme required for sulfatase activity
MGHFPGKSTFLHRHITYPQRRSRALLIARFACAGLLFISGVAHCEPVNSSTSGPVTVKFREGEYHELIEGPAQPEDHASWLSTMRTWRASQRAIVQNDTRELPYPYAQPELRWTQRNFIHVQVMAHDRYLYDPFQHRYTVDRLLDDLEKRYGGVDSVLLWPTYPNIGVDNRNQFDMWRDMPGGIDAVRQVVKDFKRRGVRTFLPIMIWDNGTRDEGTSMPEGLALLAKDTGADGLVGDTMRGVSRDFYEAGLAAGIKLGLLAELNIEQPQALAWNTMNWGYWWPYLPSPAVDRYKWVEPRHMTHVTDRWAHDRTDMLQYAFFNGDGYNTWENVFGTWMRVTPRDGEALRRIHAIYRALPQLFVSPDYEPFAAVEPQDVYASRFPGKMQTVWTIINRSDRAVPRAIIRTRHVPGMVYLDLWNGRQLTPATSGSSATISVALEPHGYGAILATHSAGSAGIKKLMSQMKERQKIALTDLSSAWSVPPQKILSDEKSKPVSNVPSGMVAIPAGHFRFEVEGVMIEKHEGSGVQFPWESKPELKHSREMDVPGFFMDRYPVTCAQFQEFLEATAYHPADDHNFLLGWKNGKFPDGWAKKPVTCVSPEDARAYARWAGKRLPHDWEWQYAAQSGDGRLYPWGNDNETTRTPAFETGRDQRLPTDVDAFPAGASRFGVTDMVGNVWQWTDEFADEHTRSALLRGGSYYRPTGSGWYFPQARELNRHAKYLLMAPSLDRSPTIGFRCVKDRL